jgi:hypothetical protein
MSHLVCLVLLDALAFCFDTFVRTYWKVQRMPGPMLARDQSYYAIHKLREPGYDLVLQVRDSTEDCSLLLLPQQGQDKGKRPQETYKPQYSICGDGGRAI